MTVNVTVIEQKALGIAAANFLHFDIEVFERNPYLGYVEYEAALDEHRVPVGLSVWSPFDSLENGVLEHINDLAAHVVDEIKDTLQLAALGIVNEAIECRLDSDMNTLDMPGLAEIGYALETGGWNQTTNRFKSSLS